MSNERELSVNQKAATFIGWKPSSTERRCDICGAIENAVEPRWREGHLFSPPALLPAPDMTDPRNYMRADVEWIISQDRTRWTALRNHRQGTGPSPDIALAALHDALKEEK